MAASPGDQCGDGAAVRCAESQQQQASPAAAPTARSETDEPTAAAARRESAEQGAEKRSAAPQCDTDPAISKQANRIDGHDRRGSPARYSRRIWQTAEFQSESAAECGQSRAQFFSRRAAKTSTR